MTNERAIAKAFEDLAEKIRTPYRAGGLFDGRKADRDDLLIEIYQTIAATMRELSRKNER